MRIKITTLIILILCFSLGVVLVHAGVTVAMLVEMSSRLDACELYYGQ